MAERARSAELVDLAYDHLVQRTLPEEATISLPVPVVRDGRLAVAVFATLTRPTEDGSNLLILPPSAFVTMDWEQGVVVEERILERLVPVDESAPIGPLLTPEFAGPMTQEDEERYSAVWTNLLELLDEVAPAYASRAEAQGELMARCRSAFDRLVTAEVRGLYEDLNPDFFRWLGASPASGTDWMPSHAVPAEGLQAWATPDPATPVVATLDPGLPVKVVETAGDWARVVAANGWTGWVDGRRLVVRS